MIRAFILEDNELVEVGEVELVEVDSCKDTESVEVGSCCEEYCEEYCEECSEKSLFELRNTII